MFSIQSLSEERGSEEWKGEETGRDPCEAVLTVACGVSRERLLYGSEAGALPFSHLPGALCPHSSGTPDVFVLMRPKGGGHLGGPSTAPPESKAQERTIQGEEPGHIKQRPGGPPST